jgi:crossover junction endodeoxyribonuclease RuvC
VVTLTLIEGGADTESVLGLDLSLTATGLCRIYPDGTVLPWTITSRGRADYTLTQRMTRVRDLAHRITATILDRDRVLMELPAQSRGAEPGMEDRMVLMGLVVLDLIDRGIPVSGIAIGTLKKWGTGSGRAEKNVMGLHAGRLYPDVELANDNEVDALVAAHCAAMRAGYVVPRRAHHVPDNWRSVKWADRPA